ncbi:MAG TPA: acyl-CoA dehydrogenase family protein [Bacteroidales bacterium]|nr:acyl-CoA dehydrogenase family protein [Bacteroidales bacterium]
MDNFYLDNPELRFHLTHPMMKKIVALKERNYIDKGKYDYAPVDFEDALDSYDKVLEIVGDICANIIGPNAGGVDQEGPTLDENGVTYAGGTQLNLDAIVKAGLMGITLPREYEGLNFSMVPYTMIADIVSRADASFVNIWGLQDCAETIHEFASEEQKRKFLPRVSKGATMAMDLTEPDAGSDLQAVMLKATYNESEGQWYLNGVKRFITNGDGEIALVLARTEEGSTDGRGLSMFIFDRINKGATVRRIEHKMGIIGSPTCELAFKNAPAEIVGERRLGLIKYVMSLMNGARLGIAAQSVGIAEAAYREAVVFARERVQFGKSIIKFPAVYEMLSSMKAKLDAIRTLLYETARHVDVFKAYTFLAEERTLTREEREEMKSFQKLSDIYTPLVKGIASEYCNKLAYDSLQIHGGSGFMKDYPIERIYRDARITSIYEGTTQLQVVAALRGITAGGYLAQIREYEMTEIKPELQTYRRILISMTEEYEEAVNRVVAVGDNEYTDFHARRLVEMAGNIIMGYLLMLDTNRNHEYWKSLEVFLKISRAENKERSERIRISNINDLGKFKHE